MKKATLLFFLILNCSLLIVNSAEAQTIQELDSLQTAYTSTGNYDTALVYADKALELIENKTGKQDTLYANKLEDIVYLNYCINEYEIALNYAFESKNIWEKEYEANSLSWRCDTRDCDVCTGKCC